MYIRVESNKTTVLSVEHSKRDTSMGVVRLILCYFFDKNMNDKRISHIMVWLYMMV